jgi:hypothetical protein
MDLHQSALFEGDQSTRNRFAYCTDKLCDLSMSQSHAELGLIAGFAAVLSPCQQLRCQSFAHTGRQSQDAQSGTGVLDCADEFLRCNAVWLRMPFREAIKFRPADMADPGWIERICGPLSEASI